MTRLFARPAALAVLALLAAVPARAEDAAGTGAPATCAERYHASLQRIRAGEYAALKQAGAAAATAGDPSLPGTFLFPPQGRARSRAEIAALNAGTALVRSRGRSFGGGGEADRVWISARLREDLGDYLGQGVTPYLCSGVPAYLETLRGFTGRLGLSTARRETLIATQTEAARTALAAARTALAPKPAAPPSAGLDAAATATTPGSAPAAPPASPAPLGTSPASPTPLGTSEEIARAVRGLLDTMREAGVLSPPLDAAGASGATEAGDPALQALAAAKAGLAGPASPGADAKLRRRLAGTLSEFEVLDYLLRARTLAADPAAAAVEATLGAIEAAHRTDCTCGG